MKTFTVTIDGDQSSDIEIALEEVKRLVEEGYTSGLNSNDTGRFSFESTGEYEPYEEATE